MYQNTVHRVSATSCSLEQRTDHLETNGYLLALTKKGAGQILDFNSRGLSFGCLFPHRFTDNLRLDILGNNRISIENIKVKKQRECFKKTSGKLANFELIVGVEFVDPLPRTKGTLDYLCSIYGRIERSSSNFLCSASDCLTCQRQVTDLSKESNFNLFDHMTGSQPISAWQ